MTASEGLTSLEARRRLAEAGPNGVDGVYDSDPKTNPDAVKFDRQRRDV